MARVNDRKVAIIGCGFVGSSTAFALMQSGLFSEMVLLDYNQEKARGEALDISHGVPFAKPMKIYAGDYKDMEDAKIIVVTAGAAQQKGETRLDLVHKNVAIFQSIIPKIAQMKFEGILLIVSNPVDILTQVAYRLSGLPKERVIGSGTVLDTARLKYQLSRHLNVDNREIHAFIIGEHGDSEIVAWSSANVAGVPLRDFCEIRGYYKHEASQKEIAKKVKNSAYEIIEKKQATYYGVAMAVTAICQAIIRDERAILPVSRYAEGEYGAENLYLSLPTIIGKDGILGFVPMKLDEEEKQNLQASIQMLRKIVSQLD